MPKYKNLTLKTQAKPLYVGCTFDTSSTTKLKVNQHFAVLPWSTKNKGTLAVLSLSQTDSYKLSSAPPLSLSKEELII